jgi:hypothetical protein
MLSRNQPQNAAQLPEIQVIIFEPTGAPSADKMPIATKEAKPAQDSEQAISLVYEWNERKRTVFKPQHIRKAWQRLEQENWLNIKKQSNF